MSDDAKPTNVDIWFYLVNSDFKPNGRPTFVTISKDETVGSFLKKTLPNCEPIEITKYSVWKSSAALPELEEGSSPDFEGITWQPLSNRRKFPEGICDVPSDDDNVYVVVQLPASIDDQGPKLGGMKRKADDAPFEAIKRLKDETEQPALLRLAELTLFQQICGNEHTIKYNRPFDGTTIPTALFCPLFGRFKDACSKDPSNDALEHASLIAADACEFYQKEEIRREELGKRLAAFLRQPLFQGAVGLPTADGLGNTLNDVLPPIIRGCKNEEGCPLPQAILYFCRFLSKVLSDYHNFDTRFPCVLLVDVGPYFGFYSVLWVGHVKVEPLTRLFDLTALHLEDEKIAFASALDAAKETTDAIVKHYRVLRDEMRLAPRMSIGMLSASVHEARQFPYVTSFEDENGQTRSFKYTGRLANTKLLFTAVDTQDAKTYVVKYTRRYSRDAHNVLGGDNAPTLRHVSEIDGGYFVVVMDWSPFLSLSEQSVFLDKETKERVRSSVRKAVTKLHEEGFVHGDVRTANILVDQASLSQEEVKIHLLDFDWAGKEGVARYPVGVNTQGIKRPHGVAVRKCIEVGHDLAMIDYLFDMPEVPAYTIFAAV